MNLIQCENVCVNYGTFEACKDVSFSLNKGDYLCVVGANGSGKTTIVKAILGLQQIKSGKIILILDWTMKKSQANMTTNIFHKQSKITMVLEFFVRSLGKHFAHLSSLRTTTFPE